MVFPKLISGLIVIYEEQDNVIQPGPDQGSQTANLKTVTHQTPNDYLPWNKHKNAIGSETKN